MTDSPMLKAALGYARKGKKVFPIKPLGKTPLTPHGFKDATCDCEQIRLWWNKWPDSNIGMPTGQESGVVVLDVDPRNGGTESFYRLLDEHGGLPDTLRQKTGGRGWHFLFKHPEVRIGNGPLEGFEGVDVKGDGGYIVVPPSKTKATYRWMDTRVEPAPFPSWLLRLIVQKPKGNSEPVSQRIPKGRRNNTLTSLAGAMRRWGANAQVILAALSVENQRCEEPLADDELKRIAIGISSRYDPASGKRTLSFVPMSEVEAEKVKWLWYPYIPARKLTLIEGDPGLGKSWLILAIATALSLGRSLPGVLDEETEPQVSLLLSAEDGLADTIRPRLDALGAAHQYIYAAEQAIVLTENGGFEELERNIQALGPTVIFFDPLFAYLGGRVNINSANELREITTRLSAIATDFECAIVGIRHLTKGERSKAIYRGIGSIDLTAACRSVLLVGEDPEDRDQKAIIHIKSNLAQKGTSFGYELREGQFRWTGESTLTAEDVLSDDHRRTPSTREKAEGRLRELLAAGSVPAPEVFKRMDALGFSQSAVNNAKESLNVKSVKSGFVGGWDWELPSTEKPTDDEDSLEANFNDLRNKDSLNQLNNKGLSEDSQDYEKDDLRPMTNLEDSQDGQDTSFKETKDLRSNVGGSE